MQLDGFLSSFPLRALLELSAASLVNGAIEIQAPAGVHRLFFVQGTLVHATAPEASGFEAFWPLFELRDAPFRFVAGATTRERTIEEPIRELIEQGEALAEQWSKVRRFVPRLDIVPELVMQTKDERVRIFEEDWPILSAVDGNRTIAEVASAAQLATLQVCVGLLRLQERGLVTFRERKALKLTAETGRQNGMPVTAGQARSSSQPKGRTGFFAKLLTDLPADLARPAVTQDQATAETAGLPPRTELDDILTLLRS